MHHDKVNKLTEEGAWSKSKEFLNSPLSLPELTSVDSESDNTTENHANHKCLKWFTVPVKSKNESTSIMYSITLHKQLWY